MNSKLLLYSIVIFTIKLAAQNTIPTTTVSGCLKVTDTLNVTNGIKSLSTITANGNMVASGEMIAKDTMRAEKDIIIEGSARVGGELHITGNGFFEENLNLKKSLLFTANDGFGFTPASPSNSNATFFLGKFQWKDLVAVDNCPTPSTNTLPQFINTGSFISRVPTGAGTGQTNSALSFYSAPWDGSGVIEVNGTDNNGNVNNGLLVNYFCGRNTYINTNFGLPVSGKVGLGRNVEIGPAVENLDVTININAEYREGIRMKVNNSNKAISITQNTNWDERFVVFADGTTRIGKQRPHSPHNDAMLAVDGKIACKSLYVLKTTSWADYVFKTPLNEKLNEVEKYITKNKHLPNMPSEEDVLKNGYDINEIDAKLLEKIELLYLHVIRLEKEIEYLKNK